MFQTTIGPVKEAGSTVYLRPETAQGIFLNFKNVLQFARRKPPFGIAQVGKSFRNEITPGNFIFRTLEFEQMEMEFFVPPAEAQQWHEHWLQARMDWYTDLGIRPDHLKLRPHDADELSHYSSATSDVEYLYPIGWSELEGIANRGDFDLKQHAEYSGEKLEYFDQQSGERYVPHVIEPAAGVGRSVLAFLCDAYDEDELGGEQRTVLKLHPALAPVKVAVLPLLRKDGHPERAREIHDDAQARRGLQSEYDEGGSIGKRYRRQDEIGTPYGVTVDHQTLEDDTVTLRDRDTLTQERIAIDALPDELERAARRAVALAEARPEPRPDRVRSALHGRGHRRHGLQPRGPAALPPEGARVPRRVRAHALGGALRPRAALDGARDRAQPDRRGGRPGAAQRRRCSRRSPTTTSPPSSRSSTSRSTSRRGC